MRRDASLLVLVGLFLLLFHTSCWSSAGSGDDDAEDAGKDSSDTSGADADGDSDGDTDVDSDSDTDGGGFEPTPGTQAAVDRTSPCTSAEYSQLETVNDIPRSCMPNYDVWAPMVCGDVYNLPDCACEAGACLTGEAAKPVPVDAERSVCICLNLCTQQKDGARCDEGARKCIPIDNAAGKQVFICGGAGGQLFHGTAVDGCSLDRLVAATFDGPLEPGDKVR